MDHSNPFCLASESRPRWLTSSATPCSSSSLYAHADHRVKGCLWRAEPRTEVGVNLAGCHHLRRWRGCRSRSRRLCARHLSTPRPSQSSTAAASASALETWLACKNLRAEISFVIKPRHTTYIKLRPANFSAASARRARAASASHRSAPAHPAPSAARAASSCLGGRRR